MHLSTDFHYIIPRPDREFLYEFRYEFRRWFRTTNSHFEILFGIRRGIWSVEIQWFARVTLLLDRTHLFIYIILVAKIFMTSLSPNIVADSHTPAHLSTGLFSKNTVHFTRFFQYYCLITTIIWSIYCVFQILQQTATPHLA